MAPFGLLLRSATVFNQLFINYMFFNNQLFLRYEAEDTAANLGLNLATTSAKENVNIDSVFQQIADSYFKTTINIPARNYSPRYKYNMAHK